jgi:hypothetical protein
MATFVVETYLSRAAHGEPDSTIARVRSAADDASAAGEAVRYLRSIFIPDDELCYLLFEAESVEAVTAVTARAGVDADRVALTDGLER